MKKNNLILLTFYKFVSIPDLEEHILEHLTYTRDIGMKGRIYLGPEGISATLTGNSGQISAYKLYLASKPYYQDIPDIDSKATRVDDYYFDRMIVKYREEIVTLGYPVTPEEVQQYHQEMKIQEFKKIIDNRNTESESRYVILDMRNSYEYKLGHFKHAIPSGTVNFREMKNRMDEYKKRFTNKTVIMYCTGWIRCEKLAVMLNKHSLDNFYSLEWWVVKYINTYNDWNRLGNLYTFDGRVSTKVWDSKTHTTIGHCIYTDNLTDHIENCRYSLCNARIICKPSEYRKHLGFCSKSCSEHGKQNLRVKNASFDKRNYQKIREDIKQNPDALAQYQTIIWNYFHSRLKEISRKHLTSQKEEYIDCEC